MTNISTKQIGDTPQNNVQNPFDLHLGAGLVQWLDQENISFALTTYAGAKLIIVGPGLDGKAIVSERDFPRCMAVHVDADEAIWISTLNATWKLENALKYHPEGHGDNEWDRIYLPRTSHVTGRSNIHDLARGGDGVLYGVVTAYDCIAAIGREGDNGSFTPVWKPPFLERVEHGDKCHINGFCLENGEIAYVSMAGRSDKDGGWRAHKNEGGIIMDARNDKVVFDGLSMPHTPRLHDGALWFLDAGMGWICKGDPATGQWKKLLWRPGFLRGLRFYKNFAFVCLSRPREKFFHDISLQKQLDDKNVEAECALEIIDLNTMQLAHRMVITGSISELYDVALMPECRQPFMQGIYNDQLGTIVAIGRDPDNAASL